MNTDDRLELFSELAYSCHGLSFWVFDDALRLQRSNCAEEKALLPLFSLGSTREVLEGYAQQHRKPVLITGDSGLLWLVMPEKYESRVSRFFALGPFLTDGSAVASVQTKLDAARLPARQRQQLKALLLPSLPVLALTRVFEYALMLHQCVYREKITLSDLHYRGDRSTAPAPVPAARIVDVHGTYEMEREMVRMVREGNLDYKKHMARLAVTGSLGKLSNDDSIRQTKNAVLVCIILFSRAAIEGGLAPEIAMTLTDQYFQGVEAADNLPDLSELTFAMQDDFVQRVHRCRASTLSKPILQCCDYINLHLEEELTLRGLAELLKYSEYYLSHRFKQEMGVTVKEYIRRQRLERAKLMLADPALSIRDVSEALRFCSQSYFADSFRREFGVSPSAWRESR